MTHPEQQVEVTTDDLIGLLENGFRNIDLPPLDGDDARDILAVLRDVVARHRATAHAAGIAEGREAMREEAARAISQVQTVFEGNSAGDDLHFGAQFGAKCAGEAVCSLPTVAGEK